MPCGATRWRRSGRSSPVVVETVVGHRLEPPSRGIIDATDGQAVRGAGGSRTRFCGFADRRPAVRLRRRECCEPPVGGACPRQELNLVPDLRKVVCASVTLRGQSSEQNRRRAPHPGIEPGLAASKAAVRPPHSQGRSRVPLPGVEPGRRPSEGRVPSVTLQGRLRSRRPGSNRHEPAYKAGASPFGHVGRSRGARI
jgi:hypothetical protein